MNGSRFLVLSFFLISTPVFGQTTLTDSQTLQALLEEVRQLRRDLRSTNVAAQKAQILIYRLQGQEAKVARIQRRVDEIRSRLALTQFNLSDLVSGIKRTEDTLGNPLTPAPERKRLEDLLPSLKAQIESLRSEEQQWQAREIEAELDLRAEETKLDELQDQLNQLDKVLNSSSYESR